MFNQEIAQSYVSSARSIHQWNKPYLPLFPSYRHHRALAGTRCPSRCG